MKGSRSLAVILAGALGAGAAAAVAQEIAGPAEAPAAGKSDGRFAVGATYGSIGSVAELTYGWSRDLHGRLSLSFDPHNDEQRDTEWIRESASLLLDWHPGGGGFRLSGGLAYLRKEPFGDSSPAGSSGSNVLTPYFGVGWGNPLRAGSRWTFLVDVGAFGGGGSSSGSVSGDGRAAASSARESASSGLTFRVSWRPIVSMGVAFRF